jgi:gliding motility-associated-like protein
VYDVLYTLHVVSTVGCGEVTSSTEVKVYDDIYIPNAFTPNGDGKNDKFRVLPLTEYKFVSLVIYNGWGGIIFKGKNINDAWDGTLNSMPVPTGIYVYYLKLKNNAGKEIFKKGTVLLMR